MSEVAATPDISHKALSFVVTSYVSIHKAYIIHPEGEVNGAYVCLAAAGREHHDNVRGLCIRFPAHFLDRDHLALGILGVIAAVSRNKAVCAALAVSHFDVVTVDPRAAVSEGFVSGADTVGIKVALAVFPAALQQYYSHGFVAAGQCLFLAETGRVHASVACRYRDFIVEAQGLGTTRKRYAHLHLAVRIFGGFDWLDHLAQEYRAAGYDVYINHTYGLAMLILAYELGAFAFAASLGIDGIGGLGDTARFGQNVRSGPRRPTAVGICLAAVIRSGRSDSIQLFGMTSQKFGLLNIASQPLVKIAKAEQLEGFGPRAQRNYGANHGGYNSFIHIYLAIISVTEAYICVRVFRLQS